MRMAMVNIAEFFSFSSHSEQQRISVDIMFLFTLLMEPVVMFTLNSMVIILLRVVNNICNEVKTFRIIRSPVNTL